MRRESVNSASRFILLWWLLVLGGGGAWGLLVARGEATAWRALLVSFHYMVPLAAGLVTWSAIAVTCRGRWLKGFEKQALAAAWFGLPSLIVAGLLWMGIRSWSPWQGELHQGKWLAENFVMGRIVGLLVLFWGLALFYHRRRQTGNAKLLAPWLVIAYAVVFSMIGFDLVMALDPHWFSTLAGGYYFMTGLYCAVACWILYTVSEPDGDPEVLHDLGNLLLGFSMFSTYLMYANLLPIWYENLPEETRFIAPRIFGNDWGTVGLLLLPWVYLGPIPLLLWKNGKKKRWYMTFVALWVLSGMWVERWWLVAPTLDRNAVPAPADAAAAAMVVGMFGVIMHYALRRPGSKGAA